MIIKIVAAVGFLILCVIASNAQKSTGDDLWKDVPKSSWEYKGLRDLEASGIKTYSSVHTKNRILTRYEFALATDRIFTSFMKGKAQSPSGKRLDAKSAKILYRFLGEYKTELAALPTTLKQREQWMKFVKEFIPGDSPFPDVQKNHWGSDAVERLRKSGIFVGYPDGLFHG